MIGRIKRVPLRSIWKHEAHNFTIWLEENIDILQDVINHELFNPTREQNAGSFSVDIVAEDSSGNTVIIENQLEKSDHDHLGKIITYLSSFEAKKAIWIVAHPRQEHINAISWLNESTEADFYLIQIEGVIIGDSSPAPLLTKIVGPSEEAKIIGSTKQVKSERHKLRYNFWEGLLEYFKTQNSLFNSISPTVHNWIGTSSGYRGVNYTFWITQSGLDIKLYIDRGKESHQENTAIFESLFRSREVIEATFGREIEWINNNDYRACILKYNYDKGGYKSNSESWNDIYKEVVPIMLNFKKALQPHLNKIKNSQNTAPPSTRRESSD